MQIWSVLLGIELTSLQNCCEPRWQKHNLIISWWLYENVFCHNTDYLFSLFRCSSGVLEGPVGSAYLFSVSGVHSVLLNQWHSSAAANAQNMRSLMDGECITHLHSNKLHCNQGLVSVCFHWESNPQPWCHFLMFDLQKHPLTLKKTQMLLYFPFIFWISFYHIFHFHLNF